MKLRDPSADWTSLVAPLKRQASDRLKQNTLAGWDFSKLVVPNGSEKGYNLVTVQLMAGLNGVADAGKRTPSPETTTLNRQFIHTFDTVRQEVFRIMEFTVRPATTAR